MQHRRRLPIDQEYQVLIEDEKISKKPMSQGTPIHSQYKYPHNILIGAFLIPTWLLQLFHLLSYPKFDAHKESHDTFVVSSNCNGYERTSPLIAVVILSILLLIHAVDLSGLGRSLLMKTLWSLGVGLSSLIFLYSYFYRNIMIYHHTSSYYSWLLFSSITHTAIDTSVWVCLACWTCLQFIPPQINPLPNEEDDFLNTHDFEEKEQDFYSLLSMRDRILTNTTTPQLLLERFLHVLLPFSCACTWTRSLFNMLLWIHLDVDHSTLDIQSRVSVLTTREIWLIAFTFSISLCIGQIFLSSLKSSSSWIQKVRYFLWLSPIGM